MNILKKTMIAVLLITAITACRKNKAKLNDATVPSDTALIPNDAEELIVDKNFFKESMQGSLVEIELGNLAIKKGSHKKVKEYGEMMVTDHSKIYQELKAYYASKNEPIIDSIIPENKPKYESLLIVSGKSFDTAYLNMMVTDHEKAIELYKNMSERGFDIEVKKWSKARIITLENHLKMAKDILKEY